MICNFRRIFEKKIKLNYYCFLNILYCNNFKNKRTMKELILAFAMNLLTIGIGAYSVYSSIISFNLENYGDGVLFAIISLVAVVINFLIFKNLK